MTLNLKFVLSLGLLLATMTANADTQLEPVESDVCTATSCASAPDQKPQQKSSEVEIKLIPSRDTSVDLSSRLNLLADECATSDVLQMIDLKESAPRHAETSDKLILTHSQDAIRKSFFKTSAVKDFKVCKKSAIASAKQLCESTLPFEEDAYQKALAKYMKIKNGKKAASAKRIKIAARAKWKRHQNQCAQFNNQFESTEETLALLKDDSKVLVFSPTHKHKLTKSIGTVATEVTE